eukprot:SAG11_NODE_5047_length_1680_cov_1.249842_1_plen_55_part_00
MLSFLGGEDHPELVRWKMMVQQAHLLAASDISVGSAANELSVDADDGAEASDTE